MSQEEKSRRQEAGSQGEKSRRQKADGQEETSRNRGTSRQAEEAYLKETLAVVHDNVENYGRDVARMKADIDEMLEHFHDDNPEVINLLENTITMHDHLKRALERNEKAMNKPYFGRIDFHDETLDREESIYIGRGGISRDTTHWMVVDWRAPVANTYYENGLGRCSYVAPGGTPMEIDLKLKRTYEIEGGELLDYYDTEVIANDDLLTKYLAKNKQAVLGEIVATIQKEQNEIIRKSPYHNVIVQGVAGSGKTTVAMHRISYILYNYPERFKPDDFYIVGSNRILLNYITGVLPDLDVYGVRQMTMEQLFVRLLYEEWEEGKYRIGSVDRAAPGNSVKGTYGWFQDLKAYCQRLEWETIPRESIYLNPRQFVEGFRDGKTGVFDETQGQPTNPKDLVLLMDRDAVERYILQNPTVSVQSKIDMLNERLQNKLREEFLGKGVKYTDKEKKAILKAYRGRYGSRDWKKSIFGLYRAFLKEQQQKGCRVTAPEQEFDVYDLAALAFLYKRVKETEVISEAHHIVIDEAQDFGMMVYASLDACIGGCTYTIMGDVSQNIHFGYGLNDWEELKGLLLTGERASFGILKKSYRNTVEISRFATDILHHGRFSIYPVEPIIRHGEPVRVEEAADRRGLIRAAARVCKEWQKKGLDTIAVVCREEESAAAAAEALSSYIDVMESDLEKAEFGSGVLVLPVPYTKGLEFDAVLILDPTREEYPVDDGHAKLLYVAATRALHELCVLHTGNLTGLIADPVEKRPDRPGEGAAAGKGRAVGKDAQRRDDGAAGEPASGGTAATAGNRASGAIAAAAENAAAGAATAAAGSGKGAGVPRRKVSIVVSRNQQPEAKGKAAGNPQAVAGNPQAAAGNPQAGTGYPQNVATPVPAAKRMPTVGGSGVQRQSGALERTAPRAANRSGGGKSFGDMPVTEKLRPAGHAKIDLAVRWMEKRPDGLYFQSRYGVLRLSPVGSAILRVTFARGQNPSEKVHPQIAARRVEKGFGCRESGGAVELTTQELCARVDRKTGAITFLTRDKKPLLAERAQECMQLEAGSGGGPGWLHVSWQSGEKLYAFGPEKENGLPLRGTARYISPGESGGELPFLLSDRGYGILIANDGPVISCDLPTYGSYLHWERADQLDFYFIAGKRQNTILSAYGYLLGKL